MMDEDDDHQHFNLKDIMEKEKLEKKKGKKRLKKKLKESSQVQDSFKVKLKHLIPTMLTADRRLRKRCISNEPVTKVQLKSRWLINKFAIFKE